MWINLIVWSLPISFSLVLAIGFSGTWLATQENTLPVAREAIFFTTFGSFFVLSTAGGSVFLTGLIGSMISSRRMGEERETAFLTYNSSMKQNLGLSRASNEIESAPDLELQEELDKNDTDALSPIGESLEEEEL